MGSLTLSSLSSSSLLQSLVPVSIPQSNLLNPPNSSLRLASLIQPTNFATKRLAFSLHFKRNTRLFAVAEDQTSASEAALRRLYVGNIPRTVDNDELRKIVEQHGAIDKAEVIYDKYSGRSRRFAFVTMKTVEDANAAIENLNGTQIGGREIKVNITEKPLTQVDFSLLQAEESQFVDSPSKVYVGNLAKTVTSDTLKKFFSEKGKVLSAKVSRVPGTSKSNGFGFVTFSSEEDVEAAISSYNNSLLEGQRIRVNKA
ncbi:hypothetical protein SLE2022_176160 [Rubroshorea leprosula]